MPAALKLSAAPSSRSTIGDDPHDDGAFGLDRLDGLHGRAAGGGHVLQDDDALALQGLAGRQAFDQLLGAVLLGLLAHEEGPQRPALGLAQHRDGRGQRHRAHLQSADQVDILALDAVENQRGDQVRALGIEHGGLHVEVEARRAPRDQLGLRAGRERPRLDDLDQSIAVALWLAMDRVSPRCAVATRPSPSPAADVKMPAAR